MGRLISVLSLTVTLLPWIRNQSRLEAVERLREIKCEKRRQCEEVPRLPVLH